ncbi:hypothetical protein ACMYYO_00255 [Dermacoccaceae bacterium W4C1]
MVEVNIRNTVQQPTRPMTRGIAQPMHPNVIGSIVGSIGASTFVLANAAGLPDPWGGAAVVTWVLAVAVAAWAVFVRPRVLVDPGPPKAHAGQVYSLCLLGMVAGMALGRLALQALDHPELQPAVVVLCVGLHFIPFAAAFNAPVFRSLGWSMVVLAGIGLAWGWFSGALAAATAAVLAGLVMLGWIAWTALRPIR